MTPHFETTLIITRIVAALVSCAGLARAAEPELYVGRSSHLRVELGMGNARNLGFDTWSWTPTFEGRIAVAEDMGIQIVLPLTYVNSARVDEVDDDFHFGNPSVAFELLFGERASDVDLARFGLALPVVTLPTSQFEVALMRAIGLSMAAGARGGLDLWRYAPEALSVFAEVQGSHGFDALFVEYRAGVGALVSTNEVIDHEVVIQALGRIGYGGVVRPFVGLTALYVPTEYRAVGDEVRDSFQLGAQVGLSAQLGSSRLDFYLHLNIDGPMGLPFEDNGIFGMQLAVTAPQ